MSKSHTQLKIEGLELAILAIKDQIKKLKASMSTKLVVRDIERDKDYIKLLKGLPLSRKPNKEAKKIEDFLTAEQMGRVGEVAFQNYLHEVLDMKRCQVKWMNQGYESKKPYDFEVTIGTEVFYIDVKTTMNNHNQGLFLSQREIQFARNHKNNYFVARLSQSGDSRRYKADSFNVKILKFDQTINLIKNK